MMEGLKESVMRIHVGSIYPTLLSHTAESHSTRPIMGEIMFFHCLSVFLSVALSVCLPVCRPVCLCLPVCRPVCPYAFLSLSF